MNSSHIFIIGNVVQDPEYRENKVNTLVFTLAGDQVLYEDEQEVTRPFYTRCRLKNKDADLWFPRLKKDMVIGVTGWLDHYKYTPAGSEEQVSQVDVILDGSSITLLDCGPEDFVLDKIGQKRYRFGENQVTISGRIAFEVDYGRLEESGLEVCSFRLGTYDDRRDMKHYFQIDTRGQVASSAQHLKVSQAVMGQGRFVTEKSGDKTYFKIQLSTLYPGALT